MSPSPRNPHRKKQLLTRFIGKVVERGDTPSLIMMIAADADYLWLCHLIVDPTAEIAPHFTQAVESVCRDHGWRLSRIKEKLMPVAIALGIAPSSHAAGDYYRVLGVRPQADGQEIKTAFRRKAVRFHPDGNANLPGSSRKFVELNDAYRTLRDPVRRNDYDLSWQQRRRWREGLGGSPKADSRPAILIWYVISLLLIFFSLFLVLDAIALQK